MKLEEVTSCGAVNAQSWSSSNDFYFGSFAQISSSKIASSLISTLQIISLYNIVLFKLQTKLSHMLKIVKLPLK